jgi:eukaryotic-like serine/threonine-protein kinase
VSARDVAAGTLIDDRYEVVSRIGAGGMAEVYCAMDRQLHRRVALKLLHRRFAEDPEFVERFRREASSAAGLQHPNVVGVYDRGEFDGTYYIAMEYLEGRNLKRLISEQAPLDPDRAIDLTLQILKAARFAHKRGVIHRDLKPHNVIVDGEDRLKVTDFGIARAGASDMTQTGSIMGTAQYLSPEQAQGHAVSAASDLYSVGIVLYEMLTGRVPFEGESAVTIALKQVSETPTPPRALNPAVSEPLEAVVMHALQKDPAARFADAESFIAALTSAREGIAAVPAGQATAAFVPPAVPDAEATAIAPPVPSIPPPPGATPRAWAYVEEPLPPPLEEERRRWPWVVLLGLLLVAGALAAYLLTRPDQVRVPNVVGQDTASATAILGNNNLRADVTTVQSSAPKGRVVREDPQPGTEVDESSTVGLVVSGGPGTATIPLVNGRDARSARRRIEKAGFRVRTGREFSAAIARGRAIRTFPLEGSTVEKGRVVTLFISRGREQVAVPSVVGRSREDAEDALGRANFQVSVTERESDKKVGTVLEQRPLPNAKADKGSSVRIVVAKPLEKATVPDLTGLAEDEAASALVDAGLKVRANREDVATPDEDGTVIDQDPPPGERVRKGATVTIVVGRFQATTGDEGTTTVP